MKTPSERINEIADAVNAANPELAVAHTNGHFTTVGQIAPAVKLEVLVRRRGRGHVIEVGVVCNSKDPDRNRENAQAIARQLAADPAVEGTVDRPTALRNNRMLVRQMQVPATDDPAFVTRVAGVVQQFIDRLTVSAVRR